MRDKKAKTVLHGFIEIVNKFKCKPNKLLVDQGKEFYNSLIQKCLDDNNFVRYSTHNEGMSVNAERLVKILKGKIYKKNNNCK